MPIVLMQLLMTRRSRLAGGTEKHERLLASIQAYTNRPTPCSRDDEVDQVWHDKMDALSIVATRVMQLFANTETVYMILDRRDQCCALETTTAST
ncbi:hypothetical protein MN608_07815 [Microdochium nivale]|nr:hypothetical protein MN608_07815 [Microdochium nivale]